MDYIAEIQAAFLNLHGVDATYVETVPIHEQFQEQTVWEGEVEVFDIRGHPKATRGYGWGHATGETDPARRYLVVLELPPVSSPETAVRAAIMAEMKDAREKTKTRRTT